MQRFTFLACATLAVALASWRTAPPVAAQDAAQSFRFVTPEAVAALVAQPRRAFEGPGAELYPREIVSAAAKQQLGIDPLEIDQLVAFVESPNEPGPPPFGVVLRMSKPQDRQTLLPMLLQQTQPATLSNGRPFLRAAAPGLPSVMLPNDRTIVIAPEPMLEKMMKPAAADSPLLKLLRATPNDRHLTFIATLDPVRGQIEAALGQTPPLPPPLERFKQLPSLVSSLELRVNVTGQFDAEMIFRAANAQNAEQTREMLSSGVALAKETVLVQVAAQLRAGNQDPVQAATIAYVQRLTEHFATMLEPKLAGNEVTVAAKLDANAATSGIAIGLLLPAVQAARAAAQRTSASNNLKQIALAMHNYHDAYVKFPAPAIVDANGKPLLSWRVAILPFIDQQPLYQQFKLDEPWDSPNNRALIAKMPPVYQSPGAQNEGKTRYLLPVGKGAMFAQPDAGVRIASITDGTSNTLMTVEAAPDKAVIWTKPDDLAFNPERPLDGLVAPGAPTFQVGFADGSVRVMAANIAADVLRALFSPQGGEVVNLP